MWSADSSTLAWQDAAGIWRWNLYEDEQPVLLIAGHDCDLIDISERGRYVRYGTALGWILIDSVTGARYANALASPGESIYIFLNAETETIPSANAAEHCVPPLTQHCARYRDTAVQPVEIFVFPYRAGEIGLQYCEVGGLCDERIFSWHPSHIDFWEIRPDPDMSRTRWRQYAYDPYYDRKAILYGDYRIDLESRLDMLFKASDDIVPGRMLDTLDLEGIVDSPIAAIEWGQPIFFDSFMLTASELMPRTVSAFGVDSEPQYHSSEA